MRKPETTKQPDRTRETFPVLTDSQLRIVVGGIPGVRGTGGGAGRYTL